MAPNPGFFPARVRSLGLYLLVFFRTRWLELLIVMLGIGLRLLMLKTFDVRQGYDFFDHWPYVEWFAHNRTLPPLDLCRETYHPPLYYVLAGMLRQWGTEPQGVGALSVAFGCIRLLLIWLGLELYLAGRMARVVALAIAGVLPASIHLDGMVSGEAMYGCLAAIVLLLIPLLFRSRVSQRLRVSLAFGFVIGLALLTKISAFVLLGAVGLGALLEFIRRPNANFTVRLGGLVPLGWGLLLTAAVAGPYFYRNQTTYGKAVLSGFDGPDRTLMPGGEAVPYLDRRTLGFFLDWSSNIFEFPHPPSGLSPRARLWPVLIASSFADYYNFGFSRRPTPQEPHYKANLDPLRVTVLPYASRSVLSGAFIALTCVVAWFVAWRRSWRKKAWAELTLLLVPLLAVAGQAHFATQYPVDGQGLVKGQYLQFAAPPLCALLGLAVAWLWRQKGIWGKLLALAELGAVGFVASYSLYCRFS